ncbi:MAG TPA: right-handed parallel beta-helix repeat-containing protein, partial [Saprospiraceae bacterium]|nr:right-handed parallel beta-helix repeat-containing protein [Saprospiraceae bacterium]
GTYGPVVSSIGTNGSPGETWASRGNGGRVEGQVNKIVSISGTSITLEIPLYWDFNAALTPQITKINGIKTMAGIEDLTVDNQASQTNGIEIYGTANCWLKGVELNGSVQNGIEFEKSYRDTFRSCKIHEGVPSLPVTGPQYYTSRAYGIFMNIVSASLIENNLFYHLDMTTCMSGPNSGNVMSYNYITAMYYSENMTWQSDTFSLHGGHARANLFEGNLGVSSFEADDIWGSSSHNVLFRNRITLDPNRPQRAFDVALYSMSSYFSIIGNVFGTTGFETAYTTATSNIDTHAIYGLDPAISASTLIHANWDSVTNGVKWNGTDDHVLPSSLYLSGKPSWWGSMQWPAIGPDVSPMYPAAPTVGTGTPWNASAVALSPPTSLKAQ